MIDEATLTLVRDFVAEKGINATLLQELRGLVGDIHLTHCMDDDVCGPKPAMEFETFNLYFVNGADHCIGFTPDREMATGLVIAEVEPEE